MHKYLLYLHDDIEAAIEVAESLPSHGSVLDYDDEEDLYLLKYVKLSDLLGIPGEAFPPPSMLTDEQMLDLIGLIEELWSSWNLVWDIPLDLPEKNHYAALVREMKNARIAYHPELGGEVTICDYENGKTCPYQPDSNYCGCSELNESAIHDIALWEEYVRSQGLDPYRDMTMEEEDAFEEEMRVRDLKKKYGDDWQKYDMLEWFSDMEEMEDDDLLPFDLISDIDAELNRFIMGLDSDPDPYDTEDEEGDDPELPF